jgi:hypothetical protein
VGCISILYLAYNNIKEMDENAFNAIKYIEQLWLSRNPLYSIPLHIFQNLHTLKVLALDDCHLQHLHREHFKHLSSLNLLNVRRNDLHNLDAGSFYQLTELQALFLEGNHYLNLSTLGPLNIPPKIEELALSHMQVQDFPLWLFDLGHILRIYLDNNIIDSMTFISVFNATQWIQHLIPFRRVYLDLTHNCIHFFPIHTEEDRETLRLFIQHYTINITGNPLHCGCSGFTQWLRDTLHDTSLSIICEGGPSTGNPYCSNFSRDQDLVPPYECSRTTINTHPSYLQQFYTSVFVSIGVLLSMIISVIIGFVIYKYIHRILFYLEYWCNIRVGVVTPAALHL